MWGQAILRFMDVGTGDLALHGCAVPLSNRQYSSSQLPHLLIPRATLCKTRVADAMKVQSRGHVVYTEKYLLLSCLCS